MKFGYGGRGGKFNMFSENQVSQRPKMRIEDVQNNTVVCDVPDRGLRKETLEHYGVRVELSRTDGRTPVAYYFPYYDQRGKLSGYKRKDNNLNKSDVGHYTAIGKVSVDCQLFGQQVAVKSNSRTIHYQEGEFDVLSSYQALKDSLVGTKWEGKIEPKVVGLSCGTVNASEATIHNEKFFQGAEKIVLGFDSDEATKAERIKGIKRGKEATDDVASVLMKGNIYTVHYEDTMKDPSDYLQNANSNGLAKLLAFEHRRYIAEKVVSADSIGFEECIAQKPAGVYVPTFPELMRKIRGIRKRELVVLTSLSGAGKTTYVSEICYHLAHNHRIGMIFLEEETKESIQRMMARRLEINYNHFKFDPSKYADKETLKRAYDWVNGAEEVENAMGEKETTNRFVFLDHFGSLKVEELMNKIKYLTYVCKCDYIVLDHLTLVVSGNGNVNNQTAELDLVMTELAGFVASNDVGIFAISHLNRSAAEEIKGISNLEEPKWICVKKEDMRGSSSLEALSWVVLGIDLEILPDRTRGRTRLTVLKNRPCGFLGEADVMQLNESTGILEPKGDVEEYC